MTTSQLIQSIVKASEQGKVKVKKVVDNTAERVEILLTLAGQASVKGTLEALYAFTLCQVSFHPCLCVIEGEKPVFPSVNEWLRTSTLRTKDLLEQELLLDKRALEERIMKASLEALFIAHRVYRHLESCTTWASVLETIEAYVSPHLPAFHRAVGEEDFAALAEVKVKRISQHDSQQAEQKLAGMREELGETERQLGQLTQYAIAHFRGLLKTYGKGSARKTLLTSIEAVDLAEALPSDKRLYLNKKDGFIGYGLKKDTYLLDCSIRDRLAVFRRDGTLRVVPVEEKCISWARAFCGLRCSRRRPPTT